MVFIHKIAVRFCYGLQIINKTMESVLPFVYGILTCIIVLGIVYGVIQVRDIKNNSEDVIDDVEDNKVNHNLLQRDLDNKLDTLSQAITRVDEKLDTLYNQSIEEVGERFDEIETELEELNKNIK